MDVPKNLFFKILVLFSDIELIFDKLFTIYYFSDMIIKVQLVPSQGMCTSKYLKWLFLRTLFTINFHLRGGLQLRLKICRIFVCNLSI
jgi:hypothetical protein